MLQFRFLLWWRVTSALSLSPVFFSSLCSLCFSSLFDIAKYQSDKLEKILIISSDELTTLKHDHDYVLHQTLIERGGELRKFVMNRYKDAPLDLIQLQESNDEEIIIEDSPYYQYKSVLDCDKIEYID